MSDLGTACDASTDCNDGELCLPAPGGADGGLDGGGRACALAPVCTDDAECPAGFVCRGAESFVPTAQQTANNIICRRPCTVDPDCAPTDTCDSGGHCQPRTCVECPSYFQCTNGACIAPNCSTDKACPGGFCVNGICAATLGICRWLLF